MLKQQKKEEKIAVAASLKKQKLEHKIALKQQKLQMKISLKDDKKNNKLENKVPVARVCLLFFKALVSD